MFIHRLRGVKEVAGFMVKYREHETVCCHGSDPLFVIPIWKTEGLMLLSASNKKIRCVSLLFGEIDQIQGIDCCAVGC